MSFHRSSDAPDVESHRTRNPSIIQVHRTRQHKSELQIHTRLVIYVYTAVRLGFTFFGKYMLQISLFYQVVWTTGLML
jgi:hypothetical protein